VHGAVAREAVEAVERALDLGGRRVRGQARRRRAALAVEGRRGVRNVGLQPEEAAGEARAGAGVRAREDALHLARRAREGPEAQARRVAGREPRGASGGGGRGGGGRVRHELQLEGLGRGGLRRAAEEPLERNAALERRGARDDGRRRRRRAGRRRGRGGGEQCEQLQREELRQRQRRRAPPPRRAMRPLHHRRRSQRSRN